MLCASGCPNIPPVYDLRARWLRPPEGHALREQAKANTPRVQGNRTHPQLPVPYQRQAGQNRGTRRGLGRNRFSR